MTIPRAGILRLRALNINAMKKQRHGTPNEPVVARQAAQYPGEHRGGEVGPPPGGQHAEPLVVHDTAQPRVLRLATPPEEAVPGCARQRGGPEPDQRDPLAVQNRDVAPVSYTHLTLPTKRIV